MSSELSVQAARFTFAILHAEPLLPCDAPMPTSFAWRASDSLQLKRHSALVEAAQVTVRSIPEWRSKYFHLTMRRGRKIAKVAMARRLAVRMYWMWRLCFMRHRRHYVAFRTTPHQSA
jgi:hypothetical protein